MGTTGKGDSVKTIIVADDDAMFRAIVKRNLERMGFATIEDETGEHVLEQIRRCRPAACLIDIFMAEREGMETIAAIAELPDRPPVIAVSSNAFYLDVAQSLGADAALRKPVTPEALAAALASLAIVP